jgi:IS30 family transposase
VASDRTPASSVRSSPGHWEGDLLSGSTYSYIVTLVERQTRYVMLAKIAARDTRSVIDALIKQSKHLPEEQKSSTNH